jgi:hypothetical protein
VNSEDLISQAKALAAQGRTKPRQVSLRRAVSAAYYAVFHALAREFADSIAGAKSIHTSVWRQTYRSLDHGVVKRACGQIRNVATFGKEIRAFGDTFVYLLGERHTADYDPFAVFERAETRAIIRLAEYALANFAAAPRHDRRAFVALAIGRERRG